MAPPRTSQTTWQGSLAILAKMSDVPTKVVDVKATQHLSHEFHCTFLHSGQSSSFLLRNKQFLQETRLNARSRVGTAVFGPTLQNTVIVNKELGFSEIAAYKSRKGNTLPQVSSHPILSCRVYDDVNGNVNQHAVRLARVWSGGCCKVCSALVSRVPVLHCARSAC